MCEQDWNVVVIWLSQWLTYFSRSQVVCFTVLWLRKNWTHSGCLGFWNLNYQSELNFQLSCMFRRSSLKPYGEDYECCMNDLICFPGTLCLAYLPTWIYSPNQPPIKELRHNIDHTLSQTVLTFFDDVIHAEKLQVHCIQQDPSNMPF